MSLPESTRIRVAGTVLLALVCLPGWAQSPPKTALGGAESGPTVAAPSPANNQLKHVDDKYDVEKIGNRNVGGGVNFYSLDKEVALGRDLAAQVDQTSKFITDPVVTEYVNRIGQNLVRNSDAKVPFTIKVIDDDQINAFALPGGFFYVNSGLILAADNEAELAGVMAHEIAHVAARHATKNATKGQIMNLASIPLIFMGGPVGYAVRSVAGLAVPLGFLKFSRNAEREADLLGVEYQYAAGYDPQAFVEFFERLRIKEKQKHGFLAKTFATHPMTEDRVKAAQEEIARYLPDKPQYIVTTSEFEEVKAHLSSVLNMHAIDGGNGPRPSLHRRQPSDKVETGDGGGSDNDGGRPTLRRRSEAGGTPADPGSTPSSEDEQRPTLKRNPQ